MKISLNNKILIPLSLIIIAVSAISTYLFITAHKQSIEKQLIARGFALNYALSKAAEEGIVQENLDLIRKAQYIINAEDVTLVQVYSNLWDVIDSYPLNRFSEKPDTAAVEHFKDSGSPFFMKHSHTFDFYGPIHFAVPKDSSSATIGFVRISLSTSGISRDIRQALTAAFTSAVITTGISIAALGFLITQVITRRIRKLRRTILLFKQGELSTDQTDLSQYTKDEIGDVFSEFDRMSKEIAEKERKLLDAKGRMDDLFDRVDHAIFRTDCDGRIIEANSKFREMFGNVERICLILDVSDCIVRGSFEESIRIEKKVRGTDGKELFIALSLYAETDQAGSVSGFDGYIMDITQQKRLEETLLHSQKMEAVGTLAGGVAHDFNNILTAIINYGKIILMKMAPEDPLRQYIDRMLVASDKAAGLTRNLLAFSRKQVLNPLPVKLNMIISNLENLLQRLIGEDIDLRIKLSDETLMIIADSSQIEQVLMNLAANARDAMPGGGLLSIETRSVFLDKENCLIYALETPGNYAVLSLSDSGMGIDEKTKEKIFEPFFTTKETGRGTGLGLSISYGIIKQHGGTINVYSETGKGTSFTIYLPSAPSAVQEYPAQAISEVKGGSETILLAEDDDAVRNSVKEILERAGYKIVEAKDGEEAIAVFTEKADTIQLVVLDVVMPVKNGREAYEAMVRLHPGTKVIFMSGYTDDIVHRRSLLENGCEYIQKPFLPNVLLRRIREVLDAGIL